MRPARSRRRGRITGQIPTSRAPPGSCGLAGTGTASSTPVSVPERCNLTIARHPAGAGQQLNDAQRAERCLAAHP